MYPDVQIFMKVDFSFWILQVILPDVKHQNSIKFIIFSDFCVEHQTIHFYKKYPCMCISQNHLGVSPDFPSIAWYFFSLVYSLVIFPDLKFSLMTKFFPHWLECYFTAAVCNQEGNYSSVTNGGYLLSGNSPAWGHSLTTPVRINSGKCWMYSPKVTSFDNTSVYIYYPLEKAKFIVDIYVSLFLSAQYEMSFCSFSIVETVRNIC